MKKLLMLSAAVLMFQAAPVLAEHHEGGEGKKGGIMEKIDTDGNGAISKSEYLAHAEKRFAEKDKDGNGEISKEEAKENREHRKEKMKEMREKMKEKRAERKAKKEATSAE